MVGGPVRVHSGYLLQFINTLVLEGEQGGEAAVDEGEDPEHPQHLLLPAAGPHQLGPDVARHERAGGEQRAVRAAHHGGRDDAHPHPGHGGGRQVLQTQRQHELGGVLGRGAVTRAVLGAGPVRAQRHGPEQEGGHTQRQGDQGAAEGEDDGPSAKASDEGTYEGLKSRKRPLQWPFPG